ncbi:uncharacterized protein F4812DRAFT_464062 [Daldinia caldariorum]|uniref:uncharacterized protein n=1 Tax=Daldinia caldariorum TaxID=326644 RepID=UPI002007E4B5|nr:uncharacterized protein F4812DRAFT_464062 [Daldinia caldariorum]KAI1463063.1 hypothetical protein F4812DRAFT_464062 [Daldinia caldariorum]
MDSFKPAPIRRLLNELQESTAKYLALFSAQGLPKPSFENAESIPQVQRISINVQTARDAAIEADCHVAEHEYICRHKLTQYVLLDREITFREISGAAGLPLKDVTRLFRLAASRQVFRKVSKGDIEHTAASGELINNPKLVEWIMDIADGKRGAERKRILVQDKKEVI